MQLPTLLRSILNRLTPSSRHAAEYKALATEMQANLDELANFWNLVKPPLGEDEIHWVHKVVYARHFAETPLPEWRHSAFDSWRQARSHSLSLGKANRIVQFYQDLDAFSHAHSDLSAALAHDLAARADARSNPNVSPPLTFETFLSDAGMIWTEVWHQVERLLREGNPLR